MEREIEDVPKIMIFSFNHQAVRISAVPHSDKTSHEEWNLYETHYPDFMDDVENIILRHDPDIVVYGSQEDAIPGSYFHSHFLPKKMGDLYYNLQKRTRLMGFGVETYKAIKTFDLKLRGLRLSLYTKPHLTGMIELEERNMRDFLGAKGQSWANCSLPVLQSKGAVASYLKIPGLGPIAFICAHLPFDAESLIQSVELKDPLIRERTLAHSNFSFNYLLQELIFNVKLENSGSFSDIQHVFFFGDLNYRVWSLEDGFEDQFLGASETVLDHIYRNNDELYRELTKEKIFLRFSEGVDNRGPMFLPTCKMRKPRPKVEDVTEITQLYNTGSGQRKPSWCDRILYCDRGEIKDEIKCIEYNRLDSGSTMGMSDHAAVYGIFVIKEGICE